MTLARCPERTLLHERHPGPREAPHDRLQLRTGSVVGDRRAGAREPVARGRVEAPADEQAVATELEVVAAPAVGAVDGGGRRGLVRPLVAREARVAVRADVQLRGDA